MLERCIMTLEKMNPDIVLRLPADKKHLKAKIKRIAKKNRMTLTEMMIRMMEWFLEEIESGRDFTIKIQK
jgi:hypothetical protein